MDATRRRAGFSAAKRAVVDALFGRCCVVCRALVGVREVVLVLPWGECEGYLR